MKLFSCDCGCKQIELKSYIVEEWFDGNFEGITDRYFYSCSRCGRSSPSATTPMEAKIEWNRKRRKGNEEEMSKVFEMEMAYVESIND